jgi:hypothetical protein
MAFSWQPLHRKRVHDGNLRFQRIVSSSRVSVKEDAFDPLRICCRLMGEAKTTSMSCSLARSWKA